MICRLCAWLCDRFCPPDLRPAEFWRDAYRWEETYGLDWEPWDEQDDRRAEASAAAALVHSHPELALVRLQDLADQGSVFAMRWVATLYGGNHGIAADDAMKEEYLRRALCAGSWMATIGYANMLFKRGAHDKWPHTLEDGVEQRFVPSYYWLAWYRYRLAPGGRTAREVRPLMEHAASAGHPGANLRLFQWESSGKFGLRRIPQGFRNFLEFRATLSAGEGSAPN